MKIAILDSITIGLDIDLSPLSKYGTLTNYPHTTYEQTIERCQDADIIITNKVVLDSSILLQLPSLKLICVAATGMNNIDIPVAKTLGIEVKNVAGYSTNSVVQHTFAMALHLINHMDYYTRVSLDGRWSASGIFTDVSKPFFEISGKRWGIIGLGAIGKEVAHVATAFGASVSYHSPSGTPQPTPYPHLALEELLGICDIISIHSPLNTHTQNLINHTNIPHIKSGAILLNLGRGGIVNETDMAVALESQDIYYGTDVLETEPIENTHPFMRLHNRHRLLLTPHIAWTSSEARNKLVDGIIHNITGFLGRDKGVV